MPNPAFFENDLELGPHGTYALSSVREVWSRTCPNWVFDSPNHCTKGTASVCVGRHVQTLVPGRDTENYPGLRPHMPHLLWMFFRQSSHKIVILSGAPHRSIACHNACGAESKDPDGAYLNPMLLGAFQPPKPDNSRARSSTAKSQPCARESGGRSSSDLRADKEEKSILPRTSQYALRQVGSNLLMDNFPPLRDSQSQIESV